MLLSICIPTTDGRSSVLDGTLKSIFDSNMAPYCYNYEVVISDNSNSGEAYDIVKKYSELGLNIRYYRSDEKTFYNLIESLKLAKGDFLKLHNDYSSFNHGEFLKMLEFVEAHKEKKEQILFTNGNLAFKGSKFFDNFNDFVKNSSYWNTWASSFSIWRDDFKKIDFSKSQLDANFPHVSILFANTDKNGFVINNRHSFAGQEVKEKGGYNIFRLFCVDYPEMLMALVTSNLITKETYRAILVDMRNSFIPMWLSASIYSKNSFTFDDCHYEDSLCNIYNRLDRFLIKSNACVRSFTRFCIRWVKRKAI